MDIEKLRRAADAGDDPSMTTPGTALLRDRKHPYGRDGTYQDDRLATFLMYLNDDYEGGDLDFVKVGFSYKGKTGDGLFFASMREGKPDPQSLHGARPVTKGEKYIFSQWIHDRPFKA